jgi:sugar phosphate isomerase/epimerase
MAVNWIRFPGGGDRTGEPTPAWPLETVLDGVAAAGFGAVGLDHYSLDGHGGTPEEVAALLTARGLRCTDIGIVAAGALERKAVERLAETAVALGAPLCIAALYRDAPHDDVVRDLRAAAAILAPAGVRMAFEFTAYGTIRSLAEAVAVCDDVGWSRCGVLVDSWHVFRGGELLDAVAALDGGRIVLVHVSDGAADALEDATYDGRFRRLLPGTGAFDLDGFADALDRAGYRGPISLEVLSSELRRLHPEGGARALRQSLVATRLG